LNLPYAPWTNFGIGVEEMARAGAVEFMQSAAKNDDIGHTEV
jgi:hypothetical protein